MSETTKNRLLTDAELASFCQDSAMFTKSGIPLFEGIKSMYASLPQNSLYYKAMEKIDAALSKNEHLSDAVTNVGAFPRYLCNMIRIGETAGRLDTTLDELAVYYSEQDAFKKRLKSALLYPVILICMMTVVVAVLIFSVLPVFSEVLSQFNASAAQTTDLVMGISVTVCTVLLVILAAVILIAAVFFIISKTAGGASFISRVANNSAFTRKTAAKIATGNFVLAMATMLKSGLNTQESVALFIPTLTNNDVINRLTKLKDDMANGMSQENAFEESGIFTPTDVRLIRVACKAGALDAAMEQLARQYSRANAEQLEKIASSVEPVLVASLAVIIGAIMLSAMLPLIQIMSSIG